MLELYFFTKFYDVIKFEELEILYLADAEKEVEDCIRPEMRAVWELLRSEDCTDYSTADVVGKFVPRMCCDKHKKTWEPGLFKEEFRCSEKLSICRKTYCCYDKNSNKLNFSSKGLNERILEQSGVSPLEKYRKVLDDARNIT